MFLAITIGTSATLWPAHRDGLPVIRVTVFLVALGIIGLLGAKLYAIGERGWSLLSLDWELRHNYRYPGGILAAAIGAVLLKRFVHPGFSLAALGDLMAPSAGIAMAIMRIGCFVAGCCHGTPTDLPWAVHFPAHSGAWEAHRRAGILPLGAASSVGVHPLQLYFGVSSLALALFLVWYRRRQRYAGQTFLLFLTLDGIRKAAFELLRFEPAVHLQIASLISASVGSSVLAVRAFGHRKRGRRPAHHREPASCNADLASDRALASAASGE
jgi:phosphatidylglycerol:prolipoprotein diacylglycerol transferase